MTGNFMNRESEERVDKVRLNKSQLLEIALKEYEALKAEQAHRIGFRNSILYVNFSLFIAVLGLALGMKDTSYILLAFPLVSLVLGWTYVVNGEKISAIGQYIRYDLVKKIQQMDKNIYGNYEGVLGFEVAHRGDRLRKRRRIMQFIFDEITFVGLGIFALFSFLIFTSPIFFWGYLFVFIELLLLSILGGEILFVYQPSL